VPGQGELDRHEVAVRVVKLRDGDGVGPVGGRRAGRSQCRSASPQALLRPAWTASATSSRLANAIVERFTCILLRVKCEHSRRTARLRGDSPRSPFVGRRALVLQAMRVFIRMATADGHPDAAAAFPAVQAVWHTHLQFTAGSLHRLLSETPVYAARGRTKTSPPPAARLAEGFVVLPTCRVSRCLGPAYAGSGLISSALPKKTLSSSRLTRTVSPALNLPSRISSASGSSISRWTARRRGLAP